MSACGDNANARGIFDFPIIENEYVPPGQVLIAHPDTLRGIVSIKDKSRKARLRRAWHYLKLAWKEATDA